MRNAIILKDVEGVRDNLAKACVAIDFDRDYKKALEILRSLQTDIYKSEDYKAPEGQVKGTWVPDSSNPEFDVYKCSKCGRSIVLMYPYDELKDFPFCHCGSYNLEEKDK